MNSVFRPLLRDFVLVFLDDILVYSSDWNNHISHLEAVLQELQANILHVKLSKCSFSRSSIQYLGHVVSSEGLSVDPTQISAILDWPRPTTVQQLRGFLGLAGYYRRFIHRYAHIAEPLTSLLSRGSWHWMETHQVAFETLKSALTAAPILQLPDFQAPFCIDTDVFLATRSWELF